MMNSTRAMRSVLSLLLLGASLAAQPTAAAVIEEFNRYFKTDDAAIRADQIESAAGQTHFTMHLLDTTIEVTLPLAGLHNVRNACAAAAVGHALGVSLQDIASGLENVSPVGGRLQPLRAVRGATMFDDSYNANPLSVVAAAEFLAALPGESWGELAEAFIEYQEGRGRKPRTIADYRKYLIRSGVIPLEQNVLDAPYRL